MYKIASVGTAYEIRGAAHTRWVSSSEGSSSADINIRVGTAAASDYSRIMYMYRFDASGYSTGGSSEHGVTTFRSDDQRSVNHAAIALLRSWREEDPLKQREEWEILKQALEEDRPLDRKLFP